MLRDVFNSIFIIPMQSHLILVTSILLWLSLFQILLRLSGRVTTNHLAALEKMMWRSHTFFSGFAKSCYFRVLSHCPLGLFYHLYLFFSLWRNFSHLSLGSVCVPAHSIILIILYLICLGLLGVCKASVISLGKIKFITEWHLKM